MSYLEKYKIQFYELPVNGYKILYNRDYENFDDFKKAIDECIKNSHKKYKNELKSLMTCNFQSFENVHIHSA
jgi:hypothetical protein